MQALFGWVLGPYPILIKYLFFFLHFKGCQLGFVVLRGNFYPLAVKTGSENPKTQFPLANLLTLESCVEPRSPK